MYVVVVGKTFVVGLIGRLYEFNSDDFPGIQLHESTHTILSTVSELIDESTLLGLLQATGPLMSESD